MVMILVPPPTLLRDQLSQDKNMKYPWNYLHLNFLESIAPSSDLSTETTIDLAKKSGVTLWSNKSKTQSLRLKKNSKNLLFSKKKKKNQA
jgi:hypothetical protein